MLHLLPTGSNVTVTIKTIRRHPVCGSKVPSLAGSGEAPFTLLFFRLALERRITPMGDVTLPQITVGIKSRVPLRH